MPMLCEVDTAWDHGGFGIKIVLDNAEQPGERKFSFTEFVSTKIMFYDQSWKMSRQPYLD